MSEAERQAQARRERAARTLRENLQRRKQQGRARRAGDADEAVGLPAASGEALVDVGGDAPLLADPESAEAESAADTERAHRSDGEIDPAGGVDRHPAANPDQSSR